MCLCVALLHCYHSFLLAEVGDFALSLLFIRVEEAHEVAQSTIFMYVFNK
jgi:hypothetical protein